jgi:hypothetical protein
MQCVIWELILAIKIRIKEPVLSMAYGYQVNSIALGKLSTKTDMLCGFIVIQ